MHCIVYILNPFILYLAWQNNENKKNPAKKQRVRKFTLEEVIQKVTHIDSDDGSHANALESLKVVSSNDEVNEVILFQRCQDFQWSL